MRLLTSALLAAALAAAVPAQAHDGHGRNFHRGYHKHDHRVQQRHHHRPGPPAWRARREANNYYYGVPAASTQPGVHVIFPNIFFPWP